MKKHANHNEIQYTQQHLANERTYLAWIRTAIAVVGIGFLSTSLHFTIGNTRNLQLDIISLVLGVFACLFGVVLIIVTTKNYHAKREQITSGIFIPAVTTITAVSIFLIVFICLIGAYFFFI